MKAGRVPAAVEAASLRARPHAPRMRAAALEARLAHHSLVSAVRVVERSGALGIAVVPNPAGVARLRTRGWLGYVEALLPDVAQREVAWRFVESLPDPADDAALAAHLAALAADPELRARLGAAARARLDALPGFEAMLDGYVRELGAALHIMR